MRTRARIPAVWVRFWISFAFTALVGGGLFFSLPMGWNFAGFLLSGLVGGALGERAFQARATLDEKKADLRDRVDGGP